MPSTIKQKKKTYIPLDKLEKLKGLILQDRERDYKETSVRRDNLKTYIRQMEGNLPKDKPHEDWEAAISSPITYTECELIGTRIDQALSDTNQIVVMKPTSSEDIEATQNKEAWFNYALLNRVKRFDETKDRSVMTNTRLGNSVLYSYYDRKITPIVYTECFYLDEEVVLYDDIMFDEYCREIITNRFKDKLVDIKEQSDFKYKVHYKRKTPVAAILDEIDDIAIYDFYINENDTILEAKITENSLEYDGVRFNSLPIDNVWFPSSVKDNEELQECNHIGIEFKCSYSEIARKQADKVYDLIQDKDLEIFKKSKSSEQDAQSNTINREVKETAGLSESSESDKNRQITFYECYYYFDINDDGYDEHVIATYFPDQQLFGRVRYLNEVFKNGQRPIDITCFGLREGSIFGYGGAEILHDIQVEHDTLHNQYINYNTLANTPFGLIRNTSVFGNQLEKKDITIKPMVLLPVEDTDDVKFPYVPTNQNWSFTDMALLRSQGSDAIGSSELMKGREQFSRTGVGLGLKMIAEANIRIKQYLKRYNRGFKSHLKKIYQLMREYGPKEQVYRVMNERGDWKFNTISRDDLKELPDFELGTSLDNLNKVYMREAWILLLQQIVNPMLIQMGIINPQNIYNHLVKVYDSYDIKDYQKLINAPIPNPLLTQEEEINKMKSGKRINVHPLDDHRQHLRVLDEYQASEQYGLFPPEHIHLITEQIKDHQEALALQEIQQMQQMQQQAGASNNPAASAGPEQLNPAIQRPKAQPMMPTGTQLPQTR